MLRNARKLAGGELGRARRLHARDGRMHVDLPRRAIKDSPPYHPDDVITPDYAGRLHDHYGRPRQG